MVDKSLQVIIHIVNPVHIFINSGYQNSADSNPAAIWFLALKSSGTFHGTPMASMQTWESDDPPGETNLVFVFPWLGKG
jgi:hypothetical protein